MCVLGGEVGVGKWLSVCACIRSRDSSWNFVRFMCGEGGGGRQKMLVGSVQVCVSVFEYDCICIYYA